MSNEEIKNEDLEECCICGHQNRPTDFYRFALEDGHYNFCYNCLNKLYKLYKSFMEFLFYITIEGL